MPGQEMPAPFVTEAARRRASHVMEAGIACIDLLVHRIVSRDMSLN